MSTPAGCQRVAGGQAQRHPRIWRTPCRATDAAYRGGATVAPPFLAGAMPNDRRRGPAIPGGSHAGRQTPAGMPAPPSRGEPYQGWRTLIGCGPGRLRRHSSTAGGPPPAARLSSPGGPGDVPHRSRPRGILPRRCARVRHGYSRGMAACCGEYAVPRLPPKGYPGNRQCSVFGVQCSVRNARPGEARLRGSGYSPETTVGNATRPPPAETPSCPVFVPRLRAPFSCPECRETKTRDEDARRAAVGHPQAAYWHPRPTCTP